LPTKDMGSNSARRMFLARLSIGAGVVGASLVGSSAAYASWRAARHSHDDWLDSIHGIHRAVFDTTTPDEMQSALRYAQNFYIANHDAYGLKDSDLAVVIIARHTSTPFGYNDAIWAKYGKQLSEQMEFSDPKTKQPPSVNLFASEASGSTQAGRMVDLIQRGAQFAVCEMATRELAVAVSQSVGVDADVVAKEFAANLIRNARMVPAGIVAVNRAQERGYTLM
jgi:intracellular sulfur oxidation DsrE/DsrF family protein